MAFKKYTIAGMLFIALALINSSVIAFAADVFSANWKSDLLVRPDQLSASPATLLIDARRENPTNRFIPNSIQIDWKKFYSKQTLKPQSEIAGLLGSYGITGNERVVVYDDGPGKGDASMIFWLLDAAGHPNVSILQGGWAAYNNAGLKTTDKAAQRQAASFRKAPNAQAVATLTDMLTHYGDYNLSIIDPRSGEEFNGWALHNEKRGGHIRTAVRFNPEWVYETNGTLKSEDAIRTLMMQKGLTPEKRFMIYSNLDARGTDMYFLLRLAGYKNVAHSGFTYNLWADTPELPVSSAPNYQALVSPEWVNQLITTGKAPTFTNKKFLVLETSWGTLENAAKEYKVSHIPGAVHLDTDTYEDERHYWDLFPFDELAPRLAKAGINKDTTVIVYSHETTPIAATNTFWALKYAGIDVRLLNGNFSRWVSRGLPVEEKINYPVARDSLGLSAPENPQYATSTPQAKQILKDPNGRLVSIRSWQEYTGEVSRHSYIKAKGEIAGSYWGRAGFGENKSDLSFYFNPDGTYRSYVEVEKMWLDLDIRPNNRVAFYCGTGSRGSTGWFYSYLMGWPQSSLYDSGWFGWTEGKEQSPNPSQRLHDLRDTKAAKAAVN